MTDDRKRKVGMFSGMRAVPDNEFLGRFRLRRWRRRLVVTIAALWAVVMVGWLSPTGTISRMISVGAILTMLVASILLVLATRNLAGGVDESMDERDLTNSSTMSRAPA